MDAKPSLNPHPTKAGLIREAFITDLRSVADNCLVSSFQFSKILLKNVGYHGQLPNVDMVSFPMEAYPKIFLTEANTTQFRGINDLIHRLEDTFAINIPHQYGHTLNGLLSYMYSLLTGPSGLHGEFLLRNIDAITLEPMLLKNYGDNERETQRDTIRENSVYEEARLEFILLRFVYIANNLYGIPDVPIKVLIVFIV